MIRADVFDYNTPSESVRVRAGFERTGEIRKARFHLGRYRTLFRYELAREIIYGRHARFLLREIWERQRGRPRISTDGPRPAAAANPM